MAVSPYPVKAKLWQESHLIEDEQTSILKLITRLLRIGNKVRINLMYYADFYSLFNHPEKDWEIILGKANNTPTKPSLFD